MSRSNQCQRLNKRAKQGPQENSERPQLQIQQLEFGNSWNSKQLKYKLVQSWFGFNEELFVCCLLIKTQVKLTSGTEAEHTILFHGSKSVCDRPGKRRFKGNSKQLKNTLVQSWFWLQ